MAYGFQRTTSNVSLKITADAKDGIRAFTEVERRALSLKESLAGAFDPLTKSAGLAVGGLGELMTRLRPLQAALGGLGAIASVSGLVTLARGIADTSSQINTLSTLSNTGVEQFQRWAYAAKTAGVEQDKLADILKDVQDKVGDFLSTGGGELADFFQRIAPRVGVTAEQFRNLSGPDALQLYVSSLEKANLSQSEMTFYLEAIADDGALLLPLLRNNGKAMAELGNEAERLGKIIGADLVRQGAELDRNLKRLQDLSDGVATSIGSKLIPTLNRLAEEFLNGQRAGLGFGEALVRLGFESSPGESPEEAIARITARLDELRKRREEFLGFVGGNAKGSAFLPDIDAEIASQTKALEYFRLQLQSAQKAQVGQQEDTAQQRLKIEQALAAEIDRLEKMRAVSAGKANADILKDEKTLQTERLAEARKATEEQLKGAERLRDALRDAWNTSIERARAAREEAAGFLQQAAAARQAGADRANESRRRDMTAEEREAALTRDARDLRDQASSSAARAVIKVYEGDLVAARKLAEEAANQAARAEQLVGQLPDDRTTANLFEELGQVREQALKAMARLKEREAEANVEQATTIQKELDSAEQRIIALKAEIAKPVSLELDITAAEQKINALRAKLKDLGGASSTAPAASAGTVLDTAATVQAETATAEADLSQVKAAVDAIPAEKTVVVKTVTDGTTSFSDSASAWNSAQNGQITTQVVAETTEAQQALNEVKAVVDAIPAEKTVTIKTIADNGTATFSDAASAWNSQQNGYATGGVVSGPGSGTSDSILARLSNGEYVLRAAAVRHYGADFLARLNSLALPRFATGGLVSSGLSSVMDSVDRDGSRSMTPVNITLQTGETAQLYAKPDMEEEINRFFRKVARRRGARSRP